jgi:hypothetical protein
MAAKKGGENRRSSFISKEKKNEEAVGGEERRLAAGSCCGLTFPRIRVPVHAPVSHAADATFCFLIKKKLTFFATTRDEKVKLLEV